MAPSPGVGDDGGVKHSCGTPASGASSGPPSGPADATGSAGPAGPAGHGGQPACITGPTDPAGVSGSSSSGGATRPAGAGGLPPGTVLRLQRTGPGAGLPSTAAMLRVLDDAERARAARTVDATQSASFVAGRYLLRILAADLLGTRAGLFVSCFECPVCGPAGMSDHGRPAYLLDGERVPLALSLSRAGGFVLLGALEASERHESHGRHRSPRGREVNRSPVSHDIQSRAGIGVDVAAVAPVGFQGFDDVALTPRERQMIDGLPAGDRRVARARLWARKEALVKALGTGFSDRGPDAVEVLSDHRVTDLPSVGDESLEPLGLVAAVAVDP